MASAFVSNSGGRPGVVSENALLIIDSGADTASYHKLFIRNAVVVGPGHSQLLRFLWQGSRPATIPPAAQCSLLFAITNFDGSDESPHIPFDCKKLPLTKEKP